MSFDSMIFRMFWLDRRAQHAKFPEWKQVRVVYGRGNELLWVHDVERGVYPVNPKDLKTEFQMTRKQRESAGIE
jgi:hypothetical protein